MIEAGVAGGSAAHHADQRRTVASRLEAEAKWLEAVAADERTTAAYLERLSTAYSILHDLKLAGAQGNIDHVVVGPGGAYLIVTRRFADPVSFRDGQLYAGDRSLRGEIDGVKSVSQHLSQELGTPVVPIMGFHGGALPAATPTEVDGVLVCAAENLVRVVTRASHTLLPPHKVTDATERALPMLFNPGSVPRDEVPPRPEPPTAPIDPRVPEPAAPPPPPPVTDDARRQDTINALRQATTGQAAAVAPAGPAFIPLQTPATEVIGPVPHRRSRGVTIAVIVSLCLVAAALGAAARMILKDDSSDTGTGVGTTTIFVDASGVPSTLLADAVPAPKVEFTPVCPGAGMGWQLVATWPGDVAGLTQYDVELQGADGNWGHLAPLQSSAVTVASVEGQGPNASLTLRITAVMSDGSRSANTPTVFVTPASPC